MNQAEKNMDHQISPESEAFEKEYGRHLQMSIATLKVEYGIDDLSPYEKEQLEKLVKQCLSEFISNRELERKGEMDARNIPIAYREAVAQWLFELYGISPSEVHRELTVHAYPDDISKSISGGRKYEIPPGHLQEAENLAADLREQGNLTVVIVQGRVDKQFKSHLQILREQGATGENKL